MKRIIVLSAVCLIAATSAKAQFLNKLKQKAQSAISKAMDGPNNSPASTTANTQSGNPAWHHEKSDFNAEQFGHAACEFQPGETLVYGEHSLRIVNNQAVVKVITRMNNQYYFYENDKRIGPFTTPPVERLDSWNRDPYQSDLREKSTDWNPFVTKGILTVDGKNYGSVFMMTSFYRNAAEHHFYATLMRNEESGAAYYMVTENGSRKIPLPGKLMISDNDGIGGIIVTATQYNAKSIDDMTKFVLNDDNYVLLSDGRTLGPLKAVQADISYIDNYGHFIQVSRSAKAVYIDGKTVYNFTQDNGNSDGKFFVAQNGQGGAWFEHGSLYFTDGTSIVNYVMQPAISTENGKDVVNWLSIQNHKLYVCKKEL